MKTKYLMMLLAMMAGLLIICTNVLAADWPQWRGPNRDGIWQETGIIEKFNTSPLPVVWRAKIANGYSGPTVSDGRVYITDRVKTPKEMERIHCFDARTGKEKWHYKYECKYKSVGYPDGPRCSVSIDESRIYSLGTMGHLFCLNSGNGDVHWFKDLNKEYDIKMPIWGISSSVSFRRAGKIQKIVERRVQGTGGSAVAGEAAFCEHIAVIPGHPDVGV